MRQICQGIIEKHKGKGCELENIDNAEAHRQDNRIDVLARINDEHVLLIEDRLAASPEYRCSERPATD